MAELLCNSVCCLMKKTTLIFIYFLFTSFVKADYIPPKIQELILRADRVVEGEIICIDDDVIELKVYKSLTNPEGTITFEKFKEWNCGKRWTDYEIGQKALFFLHFSKGKLRIMGLGDEGELPIINNKVYADDTVFSWKGLIEGFKMSQFKVEEMGYYNPLAGYVFDIDPIWECIIVLRKCVDFEKNKIGEIKNASMKCPENYIEKINERNKIFRWTHTALFK